jgi:hypothetical protein
VVPVEPPVSVLEELLPPPQALSDNVIARAEALKNL